MSRLLILLAVLVLLYVAARWFVRTPPQQVVRAVKRYGLWVLGGLLLVLVLSGRMHWLYAAVAALVPLVQRVMGLLRFWPMIAGLRAQFRQRQAAGGAAGGRSQVNSAYLRMTLEHASGAMDGEILQGTHAGVRLSALDLETLLGLYREYLGADTDSARLLAAYLDRRFGDVWREQLSAEEARRGESPGGGGGAMRPAEAREILGVAEDADRAAILAAHRRLMQRLHPDRGGSPYLAAKVNQARDCLLAG